MKPNTTVGSSIEFHLGLAPGSLTESILHLAALNSDERQSPTVRTQIETRLGLSIGALDQSSSKVQRWSEQRAALIADTRMSVVRTDKPALTQRVAPGDLIAVLGSATNFGLTQAELHERLSSL